jgi:hypothetical protein
LGFYWREVLLMSRTVKGSKAPGYDYWSRRPASGMGHGREIKKLCNGIERARERKEVKDLVDIGDPCYMMEY